MTDVKSILASRTVWANLIGFGSLLGSALGVQTGAIDQGQTVDAVLQIVTGASFLASTFGRVVATSRLL